MDIRRVTTQGPQQAGVRPKAANSSASAPIDGASASTSNVAAAALQQGSAHELVQTGRAEAASQHQAMLDDLRRQIQNGTYKPDWDVVAQRVGEALDA